MTQRFSKSELPSDPADWDVYVKRGATRAVRIDGPFEVVFDEGTDKEQVQRCEDGWLALDVRHIPFPVPAADFEAIYRKKEFNWQ